MLHLGADLNAISQQLPKNLTLSLQDGVLCLSTTENPQSVLNVDFLSGVLSYRSQQHLGGENLIKACRIKGRDHIRVLDGTCGLGTDSFLLHQAGFVVTATEHNPIIQALLADGIQRYQQLKGPCFELLYQDAEALMNESTFEVIYLDPMFPAKAKSAKTKKTMQLFQTIHHEATDQADALLNQALKSQCSRVVIKRPSKSPLLTHYKPTFQVSGKTCRFDVYQI